MPSNISLSATVGTDTVTVLFERFRGLARTLITPAEITVQHNAYLDPVISGNTEGLFNSYAGNVTLSIVNGTNLEIMRDMQRVQLNAGVDFAMIAEVRTRMIGEYIRTRPLADTTAEDTSGTGVKYFPKMRMILESLDLLSEQSGCNRIYSFRLTELDKLPLV